MMAPTARAAFALPAFVATCLYVIDPPFGIFRTIAITFSRKVFMSTVYQILKPERGLRTFFLLRCFLWREFLEFFANEFTIRAVIADIAWFWKLVAIKAFLYL